MLTLVEQPAFTKNVLQVFEDDEYRELQTELVANPKVGDVIPHLSGLRKMRWGAKGKGKRGGARIIYLYLPKAGIIYLFYLFTKGDITDLKPEQKKRVAKLVTEIKEVYEK
ncbi:addiction module toxin RelE [Puniceicoccus vermicola]|uniref:Addiction module toxin RelE n=1 Tax=Puniceicoccus vermicola TaxID=388746 RepID=A0A7X1E332_9BACT|nr:addiction module toxin RelE [Puniceicoccus vermicola]MBC2600528.1 addiction module toxin RelE [Puniceicoccus vermicola]